MKQYLIKISDFNEIVNGIKAMKADLVLVDGNTLYGTDNNCIMMKKYIMNTTIPSERFVIITKTLTTEFYNNITDVNIIIDLDTNMIYCPNNISYIEDKSNMINNKFIYKIQQMRFNLEYDISHSEIKSFNEITNDINFEKLRNVKSADGAILYYPNNDIEYGMYLYSNAIPMVKADKAHLTIYDNGKTFIANFTIYKKKINRIDLYFKFVKL